MFFTIGHTSAQSERKLNEQTLHNLSIAMHGEAFAYAKYLLYADHARRSGDTELADLLERTAKIERFEHFAEEAKLAAPVSSNADNLKDAIRGEFYESDTMYREFAQQAEQAGDHEAARLFEEIRKDETEHRDSRRCRACPTSRKEWLLRKPLVSWHARSWRYVLRGLAYS
jgi:rubrerythrin